MNTCILHASAALFMALLSSLGLDLDVGDPKLAEWHGHARAVEIRTQGGKVRVRGSSNEEIHVRANMAASGSPDCEGLRIRERGHTVVVWGSPGVDLEVRVPPGVALRASDSS